jgi:hypothetical protein
MILTIMVMHLTMASFITANFFDITVNFFDTLFFGHHLFFLIIFNLINRYSIS